MTERKSTEIKIRVTPSFKARVQSASDAAGVSLTEWLEDASKEKMGWDYQIPVVISDKQTRGTVGITNITTDHSSPAWTPESHPAKVHEYSDTALAMRPYSKLAAPSERRKEPCSHSRPPYAFCAECDR